MHRWVTIPEARISPSHTPGRRSCPRLLRLPLRFRCSPSRAAETAGGGRLSAQRNGSIDIAELRRLPGDDWGRLFSGQSRGGFVEFLKSRFAPGHSGGRHADALLASRIGPSKQLLAVAAEEVQRREMFTLLDEQRERGIESLVLHTVSRARRANYLARSLSGSAAAPAAVRVSSHYRYWENSPVKGGRPFTLPGPSRSLRRCVRPPAPARYPRPKTLHVFQLVHAGRTE